MKRFKIIGLGMLLLATTSAPLLVSTSVRAAEGDQYIDGLFMSANNEAVRSIFDNGTVVGSEYPAYGIGLGCDSDGTSGGAFRKEGIVGLSRSRADCDQYFYFAPDAFSNPLGSFTATNICTIGDSCGTSLQIVINPPNFGEATLREVGGFERTISLMGVDTVLAEALREQGGYSQEDVSAILSNTYQASDTQEEPSNLETTEDNSCETNSDVLGWIMCPIAGMLDSLTGFLDQQIEGMLTIRDGYFKNIDGEEHRTGDALKAVWVQLRNISFIILIPIMLVMVIGTAVGIEAFSAYTVKRALPRMVIAIIFISLSWYICVFLVDLFNVIGTGIRGLVVSPFSQVVQQMESTAPQSSLKGALTAAGIIGQADSGIIEAGSSGIGLGLMSFVGIAAAAGAGLISVGIIMSSLFTAAIILGGVFLLLLARQMIIIGLVLLSPLAILAWIFPGNDKMWKLWWGAFSKLLMLFPLIMLFVGVGQVFAFVIGLSRPASELGTLSNIVTVIMIISAYIVPYVFIPFAFKWAGGLFGNLAGMVNDREKGVLDRLKKGRAETRKGLRENASNNNRWNPNSFLGRRFNNAASWAASPIANTQVAMKTSSGMGIMGEVNKKQVEQTQKMAQEFSQLGFNDRAGKALAGMGNDDTVKKINAAVAAGKESGGLRDVKSAADLEHNAMLLRKYGDDNDKLAANQITSAGAKGLVERSWANPELQKADIGAAGMLTAATQGFFEHHEAEKLGERLTVRKRDGEVKDNGFASQMVSTLSLAAYKGGRGDHKPGYGTLWDKNANDGKGAWVSGIGGRQEEISTDINTRQNFVSGWTPTATPEQVKKQIALIKTLKPGEVRASKPATIEALSEGYMGLASQKGADGKWTPEAIAARQQIITGASKFIDGDVKAKAEWMKMVDRVEGLKDELDAFDSRYDYGRGGTAGSSGNASD